VDSPICQTTTVTPAERGAYSSWLTGPAGDMILAGAKNPGKLFEDTAGAGWVRVERGVRPRVGRGQLAPILCLGFEDIWKNLLPPIVMQRGF